MVSEKKGGEETICYRKLVFIVRRSLFHNSLKVCYRVSPIYTLFLLCCTRPLWTHFLHWWEQMIEETENKGPFSKNYNSLLLIVSGQCVGQKTRKSLLKVLITHSRVWDGKTRVGECQDTAGSDWLKVDSPSLWLRLPHCLFTIQPWPWLVREGSIFSAQHEWSKMWLLELRKKHDKVKAEKGWKGAWSWITVS